MGIMQPAHLMVILVVALLVLGPKRLPEVARSIGEGIRNFKDSVEADPRAEIRDRHDDRPPTLH